MHYNYPSLKMLYIKIIIKTTEHWEYKFYMYWVFGENDIFNGG